MAGQRCNSARSESGTTRFDSTIANGKTHRSRGTPYRSAVATVVNTNAAAWSTFHCDTIHFGYGAAMSRFVDDTSLISAAGKPSSVPCRGVGRADGGEALPERAEERLVLGHGPLGTMPQGALDDGVLVSGHGQVPLDLDSRDDHVGRSEHVVGLRVERLRRALGHGPCPPSLQPRHSSGSRHPPRGPPRPIPRPQPAPPAPSASAAAPRARPSPIGHQVSRRPSPRRDRDRTRATSRAARGPRRWRPQEPGRRRSHRAPLSWLRA